MASLQSFNRLAALLCLIFLSAASPLSAHDVSGPSSTAGLGTLIFPTSARSHEAQRTFERAALLLHLFEYEDAAQAFRKAQAQETDFAMAVWGEAMTYNHALWNQLDEQAGAAALKKLGDTPAIRLTKAKTPREKAYLSAVEILYSGVGKKVERDARYESAMAKLAVDYPADNQAQLFHALALEGRSEGIRNVPDYLKAAAIAKRIFSANPLNPGAAHYWIHGMDDPEHAAGALEAARALSRIAPDAGHAQHMTSHIFSALGLWDDLVQANEDATRVVYAHSRATGKPVVRCFHYNEWLIYGYFQQGRYREANALLLDCKKSGTAALLAATGEQAETLAGRFHQSLPTMRATAVIESQDWNGQAVHLDVVAKGDDYAKAISFFTTGYAAIERGDDDQARLAQASLTRLVDSTEPHADDLQALAYLKILRDDLDGLIAFHRGDTDAAIASVRRAAATFDALAFDFGPPVSIKPVHELLGELLFASDKFDAAAEEFRISLKTAPNRVLSLLGLARAEHARHDHAAAADAYSRVLAIWHAADADLPALQEARQYSAK